MFALVIVLQGKQEEKKRKRKEEKKNKCNVSCIYELKPSLRSEGEKVF